MRIAWRLIVVAVLVFLGGAGPSAQTSAQGTDSRYFPETKQTVKGYFWKYWQEHGGLAQQGYPLSGEMQEKSEVDGKIYLVQYFERAVFELHNENQAPYNVLLSLAGAIRYKQKYPGGASNQKANSDPGTILFPQTGKSLGGSFLTYWKAYGSIAQQGYPISDEFQEKSDLDGKTYTVQYFERAVFEWHPDYKAPYNVLLSQLGTFRYKQKYAGQPVQPAQAPPPPPAPPTPGAPMRDWVTPVNVSKSGLYDNTPSVAVSPLDGSMTVAWEQRDEPESKSYTLIAGSSMLLEPFRQQALRTVAYKLNGSIKARHDALGRKHLVWWEQSGDAVCNYYARLDPSGAPSVVEQIPNTCGRQLKGTALAVGPDNSIHVLLGKNNENVFYYQRTDGGQWPVQAEPVTLSGLPIFLAIEVNTQGTVMAAFRAAAPRGAQYNDIYAATRKGAGAWVAENISSSCCGGCPNDSKTYAPALAADPSGSGGFRISWSDEQCDPRSEPRLLDIYYREWLPGQGWLGQPVRAARDPGEAYTNAIAVDNTGRAHIVYQSDLGAHGDYRLFYVNGSGSSFTAPVAPFTSWGDRKFQKEPAIDYSMGYIHVVFNSAEGENKEVYYTNKQVTR